MIIYMDHRIRLLFLNIDPDKTERVKVFLDGLGRDTFLECTSSIQAFKEKLANNFFDIVLLDSLVEFSDNVDLSRCPPLILIVNEEEENIAVTALEQGKIVDYVLNTEAGWKRLPLVARAMLARKANLQDSDRLSFLLQLNKNFDDYLIVDPVGKVVFRMKDSVLWAGRANQDEDSPTFFDIIHASDTNLIRAMLSKLVTNPELEEGIRIRILHKDGSWHWYDLIGKNMEEEPLIGGILLWLRDVTKRKQDEVLQDAVYRIAQETLVTESLGDLFSSIHMIISEVMPAENFYIALYDAKNELLDFPYFQDEYDGPVEGPKKLGRGLTEYVIRTGKSLLCDMQLMEELEKQNEIELIGTSSPIWLGVPLLVERQVIGVMVLQHYSDESAFSLREQKMLEFVSSQVAFAIYRKRMEIDLRNNEARFRSLFENSTIGIYRSTPDGRVLIANPTLLRITGYGDIKELDSVDLNQVGYVDSADRLRFKQSMERDGEIHGVESIWSRKDGSAIYVRESARLIRDEQTGEYCYEGIVEDISERKIVEKALEAKVIALETLAEIDMELILAKDSNALLELVCRRAVDLLHASKACIASIGMDNNAHLLAIHGFKDLDSLITEFMTETNLKLFNRRKYFAVANLKSKNFQTLMEKTRNKEDVSSVIAESFEINPGDRAVLAVFDVMPRQWSQDDQQLLKFLVRQVALSLEKTKLLNDAEYRALNFETLYALSGEVASSRDLKSVLEIIIDSVLNLFHADCGFVYLYNEKDENLELTLVQGVDVKPGLKMKLGEGMAGRVAQSRKPQQVEDYRHWGYRNPSYDKYDFSVVLEVPMVYRDQLIGVLSVAKVGQAQRAFTVEEARLLELFAGQAAGSVFNARLFSQIQKSNEELDRLYRASDLLIAGVSSDLYQLCQSICEIVISEFNHSNCSIRLVNEDTHLLERFGASGTHVAEPLELYVAGRGIIPKVLREGSLLNVGDVHSNDDYIEGWVPATSELAIPLIVENKVIGVIDLQSSEPYAFDSDDERLMTLFANRAALMIDHVRLVEQTEEKNRRMSVLHAIESALASNLDLRISLTSLIEQLQSRLSVDAATVFVYDQNLQVLNLICGRGFHNKIPGPFRVRVGEGIPGRAALEQEITYIPDLSQTWSGLHFPEPIAGEGFVTTFSIPLVSKGQLRGVLDLFYRRSLRNDSEWTGFIETLAHQVAVAIDSIQLFDQLQQSLVEQQVAQDVIIENWSRMLELRGLEPPGHARRVTTMAITLAQHMGISDKKLVDVYRGSLLHDMGKMLLPDSIVFKAGPLTEEQWQVVRLHPIHSQAMLSKITPFQSAVSIPYCHHENWDGSGYPRGLKGEQIPIEARIFQVVETWDLMQVDLPYRKALEKKDVLEYIYLQVGKKFDPQVVEKFRLMVASER